jgi:hypothetical protein
MPNGAIVHDEALVTKLSRATGAWQELEFTVTGTTLTVRLNDTEVTHADNIVRQPGFVGVQAEAGSLEFRSIEIVE